MLASHVPNELKRDTVLFITVYSDGYKESESRMVALTCKSSTQETSKTFLLLTQYHTVVLL